MICFAMKCHAVISKETELSNQTRESRCGHVDPNRTYSLRFESNSVRDLMENIPYFINWAIFFFSFFFFLSRLDSLGLFL